MESRSPIGFWLRLLGLALWVGSLVSLAGEVVAEPLHRRIDQLLRASYAGEPAAAAGDLEVLRRAYLDLTGTIPTPAVARAYAADSDPQKYEKLLDRLLASPEHVRYLTQRLNVLFMERLPDKHIPAAEWQKYLYDSVAANKPYHQLAAEILGADGVEPALRPAAKFVLDREVETHSLTRDVGRIFFGRDLQCAQCHDHPLIDSYYQADYYGISAFLNRSYLFTDKDKKSYVAEKADGDVNFTSVFTKESGRSGPRLPGGEEVQEPEYPVGEAYEVAPADGVRPVPKFSRRAQLAAQVLRGDNLAFNRNIANRLWAMMLGRGLVEPLDLHHVDNPPVHPELLDLLAADFAAMQFNLRGFLKELALTEAYRRAASMPDSWQQQAAAATTQVAASTAEQQTLQDAAEQAREAHKQVTAAYAAAQANVSGIRDELTKANTAVAAAIKAADTANTALAQAQKQLAAQQELHQVVAAAAAKADEAAKKLPQEQALSQAAALFQTRATQLTTAVAEATEGVNKATAVSHTAGGALAAARQTSQEIVARLETARQHLLPADQALTASRRTLEQMQTRAKAAEWRAHFVQKMSDYAVRESTVQQLLASVPAKQAELAALPARIATAMTGLTQRQTELTAAQQVHTAATTNLPALKQAHQETLVAATTFGEVANQAEAAAAKLPQDAEVQQSLQTIKERQSQLKAEEAAKLKALADQEQAAKAAADQLAICQQAYDQLQSELNMLQQRQTALAAELPQLTTQLESEQALLASAARELEQRFSERVLVAAPQAKTPEQLFWSIMQATGVSDSYRRAAEAEVNKTLPVDPQAPPDPVRLAQRALQIEKHVYDQLHGNQATFVNLFAGAAGPAQGDFFATADQALFFANGGVLQGWIVPSGDNPAARLLQLEDPQALSEELYLSVLARLPAADEVQAVQQYLAARPQDKAAVVQDMIWGLIASAEFRFVQ